MGLEVSAQAWALSAFVIMLAARIAWHYHPGMRPPQGDARWQKYQNLLEAGQLTAWIAGKDEWRIDDLRHSEPSRFGNGPGILRISPDRLRRWFGVWGWDVPTAPSLFVYRHEAYPAEAESGLPALPVSTEVGLPIIPPAVKLELPETMPLRQVALQPIALPVALSQTAKSTAINRGKRTLLELHQIGQLNERLLLNEASRLALANEAWGANPGKRDEILQRTVFLIASEFIQERGLEIEIGQLTGEIRDQLSRRGYCALGLNEGSKGNWISEMIRGAYAPINRRLDQAQRSLAAKGTYLSR